MRIDEMFTSSLREGVQDEAHRAAMDSTGFWGRKGAGCIIMARSTGRFLIAHRSADVLEPNTWGTWGGAIDASEAPADAVKREVHEETRYSGTIEVSPLYVFTKGSFRYFNFLAIVEDEFKPVLDWENQGSKWVEWGKWPSRLHFGLVALLSDEASVRVMRAACLAARQGTGEQITEAKLDEKWNPFAAKEKARVITNISNEANGTVKLTADGMTFYINRKAGSTNVAKGAAHPLVWQIAGPDRSLAANTEFRSTAEAMEYIRSGKPLAGTQKASGLRSLFSSSAEKEIRVEVRTRDATSVSVRVNDTPLIIVRVVGSKTDRNGRMTYVWEIRQGRSVVTDFEFSSPEAAIAALRDGTVSIAFHK